MTGPVRETREAWRQSLFREVTKDEKSLVVSGEGMLHLRAHELSRLRRELSSYFDEIRVIAYARDPIGYASSMFQQLVKGGTSTFVAPVPEYKRIFSKFVDVFGLGKVSIHSYNAVTKAGPGIVEDFSARIGVSHAEVKIVRKNDSLSAKAVCSLYTWNRFGLKSTGSVEALRARNRLIQKLTMLSGEKFCLSRRVVLPKISYEGLKWVSDCFGLDLMSEDREDVNSHVFASDTEIISFSEPTRNELCELLSMEDLPIPSRFNSVDVFNAIYINIKKNGRS